MNSDRETMMWRILLVSTTLAAIPLSAQAPPIEIWAAAGEPIPGRDERLGSVWQPVMGHDEVAFSGLNDSFTGFGVFLADRDGVHELVGGRFWSGAMGLSYDGDWLTFLAFGDRPGCHDCLALYRHAGGALTEVVAAGDPMPGQPGRVIFNLGAPSTDGGQIVFSVTGGFEDAPNPSLSIAILRFTEPGGIEVAVDSRALVPGEAFGSFTHLSEAHVTDGTLFFRGYFPAGQGIFAERDGEITRVAAVGDPVPGSHPGEVFERFPEHARLTTSGGAVAFLAEGSLGSRGFYWNVAGTLEAAVDGRTRVPGTEGERFFPFGQASLAGTDLVFEGGRPGREGVDLFLLRGGKVTRIVEGGCARSLITAEAFRDGRVTFHDPDEEQSRLRVAYLAEPPPEGETYVSERYPDFRFTVRISAGGQTVATREEPECLADALCIGGALPDRAEVALRILGPRPNGRLWPVIGRLSPSRIEVWIEQLSTGLVRYYLLDTVPRGSERLEGLVDRRGFPATQ